MKKTKEKKSIKVIAKYERDTKRYHRFSFRKENGSDVVSGTIYFSKDMDIPDKVILNTKVE